MDHHYRVVDMMLSIHGMLRDRNGTIARRIDVLNLVVSTCLIATTFADLTFAERLGVTETATRLTIGGLAMALFVISLASNRMEWIPRGMRHAHATERLAELKAKCRTFRKNPPAFPPNQWIAQNQEAAWVLRTLTPIPDPLFSRYRHKHYRKIQMNRLFDERPGLPYWMGSLILTWRALRRSPGKRAMALDDAPSREPDDAK